MDGAVARFIAFSNTKNLSTFLLGAPAQLRGIVNLGRRATDRTFSGPLPLRIRHARRVARLTQAKLAKAVHVGPSAVGQWEIPNGTSPTVEHLIEIAKASGVTFEWLATGRGPMALTGCEMPAIDGRSFSIDDVEDRLLGAFRRIPSRKRDAFVRWMEELF